MYGYIYITTNLVNNKKYIGKHRSSYFNENYLGSGKIIRRAINKYGYINFKVEIIEECESLESLNEREEYWINFYDAVNDPMFYNLVKGGYPGFEYINNNRDKIDFKYDKRPEDFGKHISESRIASGCAIGERNPMYGKRGEYCPHYGKIAITNGSITMYKYEDEIENYPGFYIGKDPDYKRRLKIATSDKYYYNDIEFIGSYDLRSYLHENGYPKISQTAIYKLADGKHVRGYNDLDGKIKRLRFKDNHKDHVGGGDAL